ncbi:MAG: MBL fold metallo-hydrolase, partial [Spirochaetia bacterium]
MVERVIVGPWKTNCYIYSSTKKECIIIDPGGDEGEIASRVDVLNMVPVGIALTHGHVDHVAALGRLCEGYANRGYKLPIAINPADRKYLGSGGLESHRESLELAGLDGLSFFPEDSVELPKADVRLKDGDHLFGMELVVLETPGHTPGSCCFYAEKEGILFSGDTLFFDGIGRTDLPGGSEKKLKESIQRKIAV